MRLSSHNSFKKRITGFKLKISPETLLDAHSAICAEFYDEIDWMSLARFPNNRSRDGLDRLKELIAENFSISTDHMPSEYSTQLLKFAHVLYEMQDIFSKGRDSDILFAILDTGGCIRAPNKARVGDDICSDLSSSVFNCSTYIDDRR